MTFLKSIKLIDENGLPYGVKQIQNKPRVSCMPYTYDIAEGNVTSHLMGRSIGYNTSIGTTLEDITETGMGVVPIPLSALAMEIVSSSGNDAGTIQSSGTATGGSTTTLIDTGANFVGDGVAVGDIILNDTDHAFGYVSNVAATILTVDPAFSEGSSFSNTETYRVVTPANAGISTVEVHGLDGNYDPQEEFVVTNGATPVSTVNNYLRTNDFHALQVGSNGVAVGNVDIRQVATPANIQNRISIGGNQCLQAFYTVPNGLTMFITSWSASVSSAKATRMILRVTQDFSSGALTPGIFQFQDVVLLQSASYVKEFVLPIKVISRADVKVSGNALTVLGEGSAGFGFWLET